jgi:hypothetical protein
MAEDRFVFLVALIPLATLAAGIAVIFMALRYRRAAMEMRHRERLAMIEKGLLPSPEADPLRFDLAVAAPFAPSTGRSSRAFSGGILVIGFGLALMALIGVAGESPAEAIGIGGAVALIGGAFVARALLTRPQPPPPQPPSSS